MNFRGSISEDGTVQVAGADAHMNATRREFAALSPATIGTNIVSVVATDYSSNAQTNRYQVVVTNAVPSASLEYDLNGNLLRENRIGAATTFEWDGANRLIAIESGAHRSELAYDGFGRRISVIDKDAGEITSDKRFLWVGLELAEARDSAGFVAEKRYFGAGFQRMSISIRATTWGVFERSRTAQESFDYDPYGTRSMNSINTNAVESDLAITGFYFHTPSGLYLAPYRAYQPTNGRWLNQDPIGETGGINLYAYVRNNVVNQADPLGLVDWLMVGKGIVGVVANGALAFGGAFLAETGVGAAVAVYGIYQTSASFGNILNGLWEGPGGPTGPVQAATEVGMLVCNVSPSSRNWARGDIAAQTVNVIIPTVLSGRIGTRLFTRPAGAPGTLLGTLNKVYVDPEKAYGFVKAGVLLDQGLLVNDYIQFGRDEFNYLKRGKNGN